MSQVVAIEDEELSGDADAGVALAAADQEVGRWRTRQIDKDGGAAGAKVQVSSVAGGSIGGCEVVLKSQGGLGEPEETVTVIVVNAVVGAVSSRDVKIRGVQGRSATGHPDATALSVWCGVECGFDSERGFVESDDPAVVRVFRLVGSPGDIDDTVDQGEATALICGLR